MNPAFFETTRRRATQRGMTLVEVLVTLIVISVGLLGVAALQLTTLKSNQEAYIRSQASALSNFILDRMRANQSAFAAGEYDVDFNGVGVSGTTAGDDLAAWQAQIDRLMPGGNLPEGDDDAAGRIERDGNIVTVEIRWSERADRVLDEAAGTRSFLTRTEI